MIRIPGVVRCGEYLYNFWRDASNPRGLWRRTTVEEYRKDSPDWDIIIDVDALAADEEENWVWGGAGIIEPGYTRAFVDLSRGGEDASVVREFDMTTRQFVTDGFNLPEAKTDISWEDENTVLVGTDFGEGSSTDSGYPRVIKRWRRGTRLDSGRTVSGRCWLWCPTGSGAVPRTGRAPCSSPTTNNLSPGRPNCRWCSSPAVTISSPLERLRATGSSVSSCATWQQLWRS